MSGHCFINEAEFPQGSAETGVPDETLMSIQKRFVITEYQIRTDKLEQDKTLLLLGDLHEQVYGPGNRTLIEACRDAEPDLILCTGDMITAYETDQKNISLDLYGALSGIAPVFASAGNHESHLRIRNPAFYRAYTREVFSRGVRFLSNRTSRICCGGDILFVTGLTVPPEKYRKLRVPRLNDRELKELVHIENDGAYHIMLAHNPAFTDVYLRSGADLTLSGHNHGGVVRLGGNRTLISPYFFPLPRFGYGHFQKENAHAIVTSGLGDHKIPFRICNPPEIVRIRISS